MKEISLPSGNYIFVEVPNDAYDIKLIKYKGHAVISYITKDGEWSENIGSLNEALLNYKIISTTNDITEEQCKSIVENLFTNEAWKNYNIKENIGYGNYPFITAKESLQSLIQSVGLDIKLNYLILKKI